MSRELRGEQRRRRVIATARALFIERGFHSTGIAAIAKTSEVAVAQLYRDFPAKEDIVAAIVAQDCASLLKSDVLEIAIKAKDPSAVRSWISSLLMPIEDTDHDRLFIEIVAEVSRNSRISGVFKQFELELRDHLMAALHALAPQDSLSDRRRHLADFVITLSLGLVHHRLMNGNQSDDPVILDAIHIVNERISLLEIDHR